MQYRRLTALAVLLPLLAAVVGPACVAAAPPEGPGSVSLPDVVAPLLPAVVSIAVLKRPSGQAAGAQVPELGSGFIVDPDGTIVTNRHVIADGYRITVTLDDGTAFPAHVLATNALPDIALLKIDAGRKLPTVRFGDSDALRIGETVVAIGNPLGLSSSISVGVVSALNRNLDQTIIDDFIQTDAAINHGSSGGPLFNLKGEVVGVNWALISPETGSGSIGIGLAIPSRDAAFVVEQMRRYGWWQAGFAGVRLQQMTTEIATALGLDSTEGGIVASVWPGGPAEAARLQEGDVILEFGHRRFADVRALRREMGATAPGTTVSVLLWRARQKLTVELTVASWPASAAAYDPAGQPATPSREEPAASAGLGLTMAAITDELRNSRGLRADQPGVLVLAVAADSLAADAGIVADDIILRVQQDRAASPQLVFDHLDEARQEGLPTMLLLVQRQGRPHWIALRVRER